MGGSFALTMGAMASELEVAAVFERWFEETRLAAGGTVVIRCKEVGMIFGEEGPGRGRKLCLDDGSDGE